MYSVPLQYAPSVRRVNRSRSQPRWIVRKHPNILQFINTYKNPLAIAKPRTIPDQLNLDSKDMKFIQDWLLATGSAGFLDFDQVLLLGREPEESYYVQGYKKVNIQQSAGTFPILIIELNGKYIKNAFCSILNLQPGEHSYFKSNGKNYLIFVYLYDNPNSDPFWLMYNNNYILSFPYTLNGQTFHDQNILDHMDQVQGYSNNFIMYKGNLV